MLACKLIINNIIVNGREKIHGNDNDDDDEERGANIIIITLKIYRFFSLSVFFSFSLLHRTRARPPARPHALLVHACLVSNTHRERENDHGARKNANAI